MAATIWKFITGSRVIMNVLRDVVISVFLFANKGDVGLFRV